MDPRRIKLIDQISIVKDRKKQVYTFSVITFLVVIVLAVGAVKPSLETIIRLRSEIKQKNVVLEKLETKMEALNSLDSQYVEFEDTAKDLELLFPANGDFSLFLANIESLAEDSGFELVSISFANRRNRSVNNFEVLEPISISLNVEGERDRLVPFMKKLEALPMYAEINTLSFNNDTELVGGEEDGGNDGEEREVLNFSITMNIFAVNNEQFYD